MDWLYTPTVNQNINTWYHQSLVITLQSISRFCKQNTKLTYIYQYHVQQKTRPFCEWQRGLCLSAERKTQKSLKQIIWSHVGGASRRPPHGLFISSSASSPIFKRGHRGGRRNTDHGHRRWQPTTAPLARMQIRSVCACRAVLQVAPHIHISWRTFPSTMSTLHCRHHDKNF